MDFNNSKRRALIVASQCPAASTARTANSCPPRRATTSDVPPAFDRTSCSRLASSRFGSESKVWKTSSTALFLLPDNEPGTLRRNNDSESTATFRIATSDASFSFLTFDRLRGEPLNLNLFDPIGICACPRTRDGPPLQCRAVLILSLATAALGRQYNLQCFEFGPPPCQCSSVFGVIEVGALSMEAARSLHCTIACRQINSIR